VRKLSLFTTVFFLCLSGFFGCHVGHASSSLRPTGHVPYKTFIYGADDVNLRKVLRSASHLVANQSTPPQTVNQLKQIAVQDMKNLQDVLASEGYYDAELDFFIDIQTMPVTVYLKISLGKRYTLGAFKIKSDPPNDPQIPLVSQNVGRIGIQMGMPARKESIKGAIDRIMKFLKDRGKPLAKVKEDRMVIDRTAKEMHVALLIESGPLVRFGDIIIENSGGVKPEFIKSKLAWRKGDIYNREKIIETIQKLHNSRIFRSIKITNAETANDQGFMDVYVNLKGSPPSEYSIGSSYQPKQGLIHEASWEGRNLMNGGEIFNLSTHFGSKQKTAELSFLIPDFQKINMDFTTKMRAGKWNFPAFDKKGFEMKSSLTYPIFGPQLIGDIGLSFEINNVSKNGERENSYRILGLPLGLKYSSVVGGWQPRKGVRVKARAYPYATIFGKLKSHVRLHLKPEGFYPLTKSEDVVATAWMDAGFTPGAGKSTVPSHKLYYPGGSGSMRGYKFQMACPLDANKNPIGGRSMLLLGIGVNNYVTDSLTLSGYMNWGSVYDRQYSDFSKGMLWGIGAGIKYHSIYGDLSFDIASPVKRRAEDSSIEFYLSFNMKPYEVYQGLSKSLAPPAI
jgi:translocation and assembly module TamA